MNLKTKMEWKKKLRQFNHTMGFCRGNLMFIRCGDKVFLECIKCLYRSKELLVKEIKS